MPQLMSYIENEELFCGHAWGRVAISATTPLLSLVLRKCGEVRLYADSAYLRFPNLSSIYLKFLTANTSDLVDSVKSVCTP